MDFIDTKRKKLFYILLAMQVAILAFSIAGGSLATGVFMTIMRVVLLVVSYCCVQSSWAALYSVFALISALYSFDPVGLFITGHGDARTAVQNICCVVAFGLGIATSYIGYLYTGSIQHEQVAPFNGDNDDGYGQNNQNPFSYGGTNYMYQNSSNNNNDNNPNPYLYQRSSNGPYPSTQNRNSNQWQPFAGQGYSLS